MAHNMIAWYNIYTVLKPEVTKPKRGKVVQKYVLSIQSYIKQKGAAVASALGNNITFYPQVHTCSEQFA